MVKKMRFGSPLETEAVIREVPLSQDLGLHFHHLQSGELQCRMDERDIVYGLGENVRGINKRGWKYISNNSDQPHHEETTHSLYASHNFLVIDGPEHSSYGIFVDTPARVTFDVGYNDPELLVISVDSNDYDLYIFEADEAQTDAIANYEEEKPSVHVYSAEDAVKEFRGLIGPSYLPPKWAFGYGQSRWSYMNSTEVREVASQFKQANIPLDSIYLDIDYMERYKDFTIDRDRFPDFEELVQEMRAQGIHLVPIIDGGVKVEEGYDVYEEGVEKGYFCKDSDGKEFVVGVWPGRSVLPDMLNDDARTWFGDKYQILTDMGIDGFWNDMNEPALFYSERRLSRLFEELPAYQGKNLDLELFNDFRGKVASLEGNPEDYQSFYHEYKGKHVRHDRVHNLFGYYMTRSAGEAFERNFPDRRILMFSRSSYIGMHRYGGVWQGDNQSWWSHLLMTIKMLPSLNMCGYLYTGADIGGFLQDTTADLLLRWVAFGIFVPLMRNHSAMGTRRQEPYVFGDKTTERMAELISLRYRLLPYLYSEFMKAALNNDMYARPLGFVWPDDEIARHTEDELMIGESILVAPVYEQNAIGRNVYLPEEMKLVRFQGAELKETKIVSSGHHYIRVALDEIVFFIRKGHLLPLAPAAMNVEELDENHLELLGFSTSEEITSYLLYRDDGLERNPVYDEHIQELFLDSSK